jgi:hypothetical protein
MNHAFHQEEIISPDRRRDTEKICLRLLCSQTLKLGNLDAIGFLNALSPGASQ